MYCLVLFTVLISVASIMVVSASSMCNIHQLREFSRNSSCNKRIYRLLLTFLSSNRLINETEVQSFCTQECAGNFIDFLRNQWNCQKEFKDLYLKILTSLCRKNKEGQQCIHMLHPSQDDLWNSLNSSILCSQEHHSHLQGLLDKYGCCFELTFGARIKSEPEQFCDIQSPPLCPLDYELSTPAVGGLTPNDRSLDTNELSSSDLRTTMSFTLLYFILVPVVAVSTLYIHWFTANLEYWCKNEPTNHYTMYKL